ncbi:MAG: sensor histidine kinase [Candidatus Dormibacteria bacterium]
MRTTWQSAEKQSSIAASDVAGEIVWAGLAGVAVFDHAGRLAYSNRAFSQSSRLTALVDGRGYLVDPDLEGARRSAVHRGAKSGAQRIPSAGSTLDFEVIPLQAAPEWTAIVVRPQVLADERDSEALSLSLLLHELRGPLLLAQESLEVLTQLVGDSPVEFKSAVSRQSRSIARLTGLVQGLADLSRARDLDRGGEAWSSVNLAEQVEEVAEIYRDLASARGFELIVKADRAAPPIHGHSELLARAIANLVDNALKYGTSPGRVRLAMRESGALLVVEVADSGPGIAACDQATIFTEFHRLPAARAAQIPGTGLGLAVARRVVEAHGGRLSLESQPGFGSTFKLSFLAGRSGQLRHRRLPLATP